MESKLVKFFYLCESYFDDVQVDPHIFIRCRRRFSGSIGIVRPGLQTGASHHRQPSQRQGSFGEEHFQDERNRCRFHLLAQMVSPRQQPDPKGRST